jgi:hypothetical protein
MHNNRLHNTGPPAWPQIYRYFDYIAQAVPPAIHAISTRVYYQASPDDYCRKIRYTILFDISAAEIEMMMRHIY